MDSSNELRLVTKAIAGDREALGSILEQYAPQVRRTLEGRIDARWRSVLSEDDILQQTFADAFLGIKRFQYHGSISFVAWLNTMARNNLNDAVKHLQSAKSGGKEARVSPSSDESYHRLMHEIAAMTSTPSMKVARTENHAELHLAIKRLPASYAHVIQKYDLEGISADELAKEMGCSVGALHMRRSRALVMLGELLGTVG